MRCFVTGGSGFVGSHLCERLRADGHEVWALVRKTSNVAHLEACGARLIEGSLESQNVIARWAPECDVVFHLAAVTKSLRPEGFRENNVRGTFNLLRGLERGDFKGRILYLSSLSAGGPAPSASTLRRERDLDRPVSLYGKSKRAAERVVKEKLPPGCTFTILRPGPIYGPRELDILEVFKMMQNQGIAVQFGAGVVIQMTHVEDIVSGIVAAAFSEAAAGKTYYLTEPTRWRFADIIELAQELVDRPVRLIRLPMWTASALGAGYDLAGRIAGRLLGPMSRDKAREMTARFWLGDPGLIERELGWEAKWAFPDGLRATLAWYRKEGKL